MIQAQPAFDLGPFFRRMALVTMSDQEWSHMRLEVGFLASDSGTREEPKKRKKATEKHSPKNTVGKGMALKSPAETSRRWFELAEAGLSCPKHRSGSWLNESQRLVYGGVVVF
jgi:hypothetical protein